MRGNNAKELVDLEKSLRNTETDKKAYRFAAVFFATVAVSEAVIYWLIILNR